MNTVYVIFGRKGCHYTESAKELAENSGIKHKYYNVSKVPCPEIPEPFRTMAIDNGRRTVPCIFKVELIGGFDNFDSLFDKSEYSSDE